MMMHSFILCEMITAPYSLPRRSLIHIFMYVPMRVYSRPVQPKICSFDLPSSHSSLTILSILEHLHCVQYKTATITPLPGPASTSIRVILDYLNVCALPSCRSGNKMTWNSSEHRMRQTLVDTSAGSAVAVAGGAPRAPPRGSVALPGMMGILAGASPARLKTASSS